MYARLGWLDKAAWYYDQAVAMGQEAKIGACLIELMVKAAWVRVKQGKFEQASGQLKKALERCGERTPAHTWASVHRHLGALYLERLSLQVDLKTAQEDIVRALKHTQHSLEHLEHCEDLDSRERQEDLALVLNNFGRAYFYGEEFEEARQSYQEALKIADQLGHRALGAYMRNNLGGLEAKLENHPVAIRYLRESLEITDEEDNLFLRCKSLLNLGTTLSKDQSSEAKRYLEEAYWISRFLGNRFLFFDTSLNLAIFHHNTAEWGQAERYLLEADRAQPDNVLVQVMLEDARAAQAEQPA